MINRLSFCLLLLLLPPSTSHAQTNPYDTYWVSAGVGKTYLPSLMGTVSFQPRHKTRVFTARYNVSAEMLHQTTPGLKLSEAGVLYGSRHKNFIFSAGISRVWGVYRGTLIGPAYPGSLFKGDRYEKKTFSTLSIPAEVRFILPLKWVGIGITAFGNLNNGHSYSGLNVSVYAGCLE